MKPILKISFAAALCAGALSASSQSFGEVASATLDAVRESRDQAAAPENIRAIFTKAKEAEEDGNVNFCGFYVGMSRADADELVAHYALKDGESSLSGAPIVGSIHFSLKGVRRITKGGNSYEELCQAVANRVGSMHSKSNWKGDEREEWFEYKTIDGVRVTIAETRLQNANIDAGFNMVDTTGSIRKEAERKAAETRAKERASQLDSSPAVKAAAESILASMVDIPCESYKMGKTEVTQAQWEAIMGENPSRFRGENNPLENVSWDDCQAFLKLLNSVPTIQASGLTFRLPKVSEWEYACRAGVTEKYCKLSNGTEILERTLGEVAWFCDNSDEQTHPVGLKQPNAFGLYDMHGNVAEWCQEEYAAHKHRHVSRGGNWALPAKYCEFSSRGDPLLSRGSTLGFRLCASGCAD